MTTDHTPHLTLDEQSRQRFPGFHDIERAMQAMRRRTNTREQLYLTHFFADETITAVHVDHLSRCDRDVLRAYDADGTLLDTLISYIDEPYQKLVVTEGFDHDVTGLPVAPDSELAHQIATDHGWVIDMATLRSYDQINDIHAVQRQMLIMMLAQLAADDHLAHEDDPDPTAES